MTVKYRKPLTLEQKEAARKRSRNWYDKNKELANSRSKIWNEENKDRRSYTNRELHKLNKERNNRRSNVWYEENKEITNARSKRRYEANKNDVFAKEESYRYKKYGITVAQYDVLLAAQNYRCAVCGDEPKNRKLCVDHVHGTSVVRGLLCVRCNTAEGLLRSNPDVVDRLAEYIRGDCPAPSLLANTSKDGLLI